jgi:glucokinase
LRDILAERSGLPAWLDHDCRAAALAEQRWGAGRGCADMVYVTASTGIGGGILLGGRLWRGAAESAGEIGHCVIDQNGPLCGCGRRGCVEAFASGTAIARRAREALAAGRASSVLELAGGDPSAVTAREVALAAAAGDPLGVELLAEAGRALGIGFAILANVLNPPLIVVGGSLVKAGALLLGPARDALAQWSVPGAAEATRLEPAQLGDDVGILGAALLALEE